MCQVWFWKVTTESKGGLVVCTSISCFYDFARFLGATPRAPGIVCKGNHGIEWRGP